MSKTWRTNIIFRLNEESSRPNVLAERPGAFSQVDDHVVNGAAHSIVRLAFGFGR